MLALIGAVKEETGGLKKLMVIEETAKPDGGIIYRGKLNGKPVLLAQSGPGKSRAERMTKRILDEHKPAAVISFGFAGGLTAGSKIGDIFACSALGCESPGSEVYGSDPGLMAASGQVADGKFDFRQGRTVTTRLVIGTPALKQKLGKASGADIVEMESYWVARLADKRVPFLAVRVVSDTVRESLPSFEHFLNTDGSLNPTRALGYFMSHPWQLKLLVRLNLNTRRARSNLTEFMRRLVAEAG